jgi:ABC-type xylose transport system permease subunit
MRLSGGAKAGLLGAAGILVFYGIILTVIPDKVWTPFAAKFTVPKIGWIGVFVITIVLDWIAAILAFFVLRRMKAPASQGEAAAVAPQAGASPARA